MNPNRVLPVLLALALLAGCRLEERMAWSPDGSRAAVWSSDGLRLADGDGTLSPAIATHVTFAAWLPDGRGLILLRETAIARWAEVTPLVPREETAPFEAFAPVLPGLARAALAAAGGDPDAVESKFIRPLNFHMDPGALFAAATCLRDTRPEDWKEFLRATQKPDEWEKNMKEGKDGGIVVREISVLRLEGIRPAGLPQVLERTIHPLADPRPSPTAPVLAFIRNDTLVVVALDGSGGRIEAAERVAGSYDWTPDGRSLVFAVRTDESWESASVNLAHLRLREVIAPDGAIRAGNDRLLGVSAFAFPPRIRCLPDGRALFAGTPLTLPAPDLAGTARFFTLALNQKHPVAPTALESKPGSLPADLSGFAASPDGRRIAVAESGSDAVAVFEIATGRTDVIAPPRGAKSRTLPAWRGNRELFFAALPEAGSRRPDWWRWSAGTTTAVFSARWPASSVGELMEQPQTPAAGNP